MRRSSFLALLLFAPAALAQEALPLPGGDDLPDDVRYADRTEIDFETVDVRAGIVGPDGKIVRERPKAKFNPLIRVRDDFRAEMNASIDAVK